MSTRERVRVMLEWFGRRQTIALARGRADVCSRFAGKYLPACRMSQIGGSAARAGTVGAVCRGRRAAARRVCRFLGPEEIADTAKVMCGKRSSCGPSPGGKGTAEKDGHAR